MQAFLFCSKELVDWLPHSTGKVKSRWYLNLLDFSLYSIMATVYIIYSANIDQFYTGSCLDLKQRLEQHSNKSYQTGFTHRADDWTLFYSKDDLEYETARKIETHIKKMK
ncbi:GIY-YIG catalytic domain protein [compost metagenome]